MTACGSFVRSKGRTSFKQVCGIDRLLAEFRMVQETEAAMKERRKMHEGVDVSLS